MCKLKSAIILQDRVFLPDYDSYDRMLKELGIDDTRENAQRLFVRAELSPKDGDIFSDVGTWVYRVDQDILPDWYVPSFDEQRMRDAVSAWYKEHVHINETIGTLNAGVHYIKDGTVGSICDNAKVGEICGSAKINRICGSAKIGYIYGSATVGDISGKVIACAGNWKNIGQVKVSEDAVLIDRQNREIICNGFKIKERDGNA